MEPEKTPPGWGGMERSGQRAWRRRRRARGGGGCRGCRQMLGCSSETGERIN